jgi:outer membrane immunogenic protein
MKKLILASIVSAFGFGSAIAADALIPVKASPPQYYDWSGIYVGLHAGHAWDRTQGSNQFFSELTDQKFGGGLGGGQIGINHQIGRVVLGLELSGTWSGAKGNSDCFVNHFFTGAATVSCSATQDWSANLLARLGYAPGDGRFLPYILGGLSMAQLQAAKQVTFGGLPPANSSVTTTIPWGSTAVHEGAVLGFGAQYAITPRVYVGLDYLYGVYGVQEHGSTASYRQISNFPPFVSTFSGASLFNSPQNLTTHTARFVINFKLD